jgi:trimethylamine--corrinoid protein Co-methyltransferase
MSKQIKSVTDPNLSMAVLSASDIEKIHEATLEIIERTGVRFPSKRALALWEEYGAQVDHDTQVVRVKTEIIEEAIEEGEPEYVLAARDRDQDLPLDGNHVFVGTDGCGVQVVDLETNEVRTSRLQDVGEIARVADALEEVAFNWTAVSAQDRPPESRGLHELSAIWQNSTKHVQTESVYSEQEARAAVEMAKIVAGGNEALSERSPLSIMQCTASPLGHDGGSLDAALVAAEAGLPVGFMTMAASLTTAPATLAGTLAVGNAEVLSAAALLQLTYPGTKFFYAAAQTASDLRTGAYTGGGPEDFLYGAATNELADFYDMPLSMGAFATGAKAPDWQAGLENALSSFMATISMSDMLLGVGLLHGSRIWSYEQMLMDCEIFAIVHKMMGGIVIDDETLALDVIHAAGPGGNYLTQKHTMDNMREVFVPKYLDRRPFETWEQDPDFARRTAREKAREILATHQPEPLDSRITAEFDRIIASVEGKQV